MYKPSVFKIPTFKFNSPVVFVFTGIVATLIIFIAQAWYLWGGYRQQKVMIEHALKMDTLCSEIIYLDEVLTMSARMSASTGEPQWEVRYRKFEPQLDNAIKEAKAWAPNVFLLSDAKSLDVSNLALVALENKSFELVRSGRQAEALALLTGAEYETQKEIYAKGIYAIAQAAKKEVFAASDASRTWLSTFFLQFLLIVVFLIGMWIFMTQKIAGYERDRDMLDGSLRKEKNTAQAYLNVAAVMLVAIDIKGKVTLINQRGCDILGYSKDDIIGKSWFENFIPLEASVDATKIFKRLLHKEDGLFGYYESYILTQDKRMRLIGWNNIIIRNQAGEPVEVLSSGEDITERRATEEKSARSNRMYSVLSGVNKAIVRVRDVQELLNEVCRIAVEVGAFRMAWVGMLEPDYVTVKAVSVSGKGSEFFKRIRVLADVSSEGQGPVGTAIREKQSIVVDDISKDSRVASWRYDLIERGCRSLAVFPLLVHGRAIGACCFLAGEPSYFDKDEVELLQELAMDISFSLESMDDERQRSSVEQSLERATKDWQVTFDVITDSMMILDKDFKIMRANRVTEKILGKDLREIINKHCYELMHETNSPPEFCPLSRALSTGGYEEREVYLPQQGIWGWITVTPVFNENGKPFMYIHSVRDITARKQVEEMLRQSQERHQIIALETGQLVYDCNLAKGSIEWEGAIEGVTGFTPDDFRHVDVVRWAEMIHPDDRQRVLAAFEESKKKGERFHLTYRLQHKSAGYVAIEDAGLFLQDEKRMSNRMLGVVKRSG